MQGKKLPHTANTSGTNCMGLNIIIVPLRGTARFFLWALYCLQGKISRL